MKHLLSLLIAVFFCGIVSAQTVADSVLRANMEAELALSYIRPVVKPVAPDSADVKRLEHKSFWRASAEVVGLNMGVWAFDRYVQKGEFAYISWNTVKENFKHGFEWDNDHLSTNIFAHPYNGSMYYNAGRSNGFNFWQSSLFAIGGSAMWEMFMEKEYPSTNDIIATPIGGTAIGEVFYRTSDLVLDDRSWGGERLGREVAAFVISPMRGFTRIVTGRAWERRPTSGRRFGTPPVRLSFSLGSRMLLFHDGRNYSKAGLTGRVNIEYGNKFSGHTRYPYDYFTLLVDLDVMKTQPVLSRLEIKGRLLSKEIFDSKSGHVSVGLYQHFDFMDSDTISDSGNNHLQECLVPYKLGIPASLGGGTVARYTHDAQWQVEGFAHVNAVFLGGILTDFYRNYHRNYNWGSGFSLKGGFHWFNHALGLNAGANARFYRIYTLKGCELDYLEYPDLLEPNVQGDKCNTSFINLNLHCNYRIWKKLYATVMFDWYRRYSHYLELNLKDAGEMYPAASPIFTSDQIGLKLMLTYNL